MEDNPCRGGNGGCGGNDPECVKRATATVRELVASAEDRGLRVVYGTPGRAGGGDDEEPVRHDATDTKLTKLERNLGAPLSAHERTELRESMRRAPLGSTGGDPRLAPSVHPGGPVPFDPENVFPKPHPGPEPSNLPLPRRQRRQLTPEQRSMLGETISEADVLRRMRENRESFSQALDILVRAEQMRQRQRAGGQFR
jgi:hypothetical protein